jgi:Berberine and berberine like
MAVSRILRRRGRGLGGGRDAVVARRAVRFAGRRGLPAGVLATGHYLSARDTEPGGVRDAFGKDVHDRLAMVKRGYDPANLFRVNHNIPPIR